MKYLILHYPPRGKSNGHWDMVKGHVDKGEKEIDTLFRETEEETGLQKDRLELIDGFKKEIHYNFRTKRGLHYKEVVFYLLKSKTKKVTLSYEHDNCKWLAYKEALETLTFRGGKEMLIKANKHLINIEKL